MAQFTLRKNQSEGWGSGMGDIDNWLAGLVG